jgi:hypothetical protein
MDRSPSTGGNARESDHPRQLSRGIILILRICDRWLQTADARGARSEHVIVPGRKLGQRGRAGERADAELVELKSGSTTASIGGLGLYFVRKLMDHVDYEHVNGQNRVMLIKNTAT